MRYLINEPRFPIRLYDGRIDATPAAFIVVLNDRHGLYFWLMASNPAFVFESPSKLLLAHIRQEAITAAVPRLFWLRGDEPYKAQWGAKPDYSYALSDGGIKGSSLRD